MSAWLAARGSILLALVGLLGVAGPVPPCDPAGRDFCGLDRPEDVAMVPGTKWLAVSTASLEAPLVFIEVGTKRRVQVMLPIPAPTGTPPRRNPEPTAAECIGPPARVRAGGNDVRRVDGELRLALINHPEPGSDGDRVELFSITQSGGVPIAHWFGCIPVTPPYMLNDVALGPDGELFASHEFERPHTAEAATALKDKFLAGKPTGFALEWTRAAGWTQLAGTEVSFANGIAVSANGRTIAVAGTYDQAVVLVDRQSGAVRRIPVPLQPDNLTALRDNSFLVVGHTGVPVTGIDPCRDPSALPCGFPFAVAHIDPKGRVTVVFEHDGSRIPGASVAVLEGTDLYLGSAFGDRVTVLDRPPGLSAG
jgi:hypothetical protein